MTAKIILILICIVIALAGVITLLFSIVKSKNKQIKSLQKSLQKQSEIITELNEIKQQRTKKKKAVTVGSAEQKFKNSLDILKAQKEQEKKE